MAFSLAFRVLFYFPCPPFSWTLAGLSHPVAAVSVAAWVLLYPPPPFFFFCLVSAPHFEKPLLQS